MSYPDYAMSQGGEEDGDFGYLEFEAGTQDSQYDYSDFGMPSQQTQLNHGTQDDLNFMSLSLDGGPQSQSELGGTDDPYHHQQHSHNQHGLHHASGTGDQRGLEETDEQDLNDQPLALTELPPHACKYVLFLSCACLLRERA